MNILIILKVPIIATSELSKHCLFLETNHNNFYQVFTDSKPEKKMNFKNSLAGLLTVATLVLNSASFAGVDTETDSNGVILAGYDAVSYFTKNAAVEGSVEYTAVHNNAIYRFSSLKNRDLFSASPAKYEPQFGGFCAYGAALGKKFEVNGKAFEIVDGKLYVNKNEDVYETWVEDKDENIVSAKKEWLTIKDIAAGDL